MKSQPFCGGRFFKFLDPLKIHDFEYWMYRSTGYWEYKSPQRWKTILYRVYRTTMAVVYAVMLALYVMGSFTLKDGLQKLYFNLSTGFLLLVTIVKVILLFNERESLEEVRAQLRGHLLESTRGVSAEDEDILRKKAEVLTTITVGFYTFLALGLPLRVIADTTLEPKAYLIPMPLREALDPYFGLIYAHQAVIIFHFMVVVLSHDLLVFSFLIQFIAHYEILAKNFHKMKALYPTSNFEKYVRGFVDYEEDVFGEVALRRRHHKILLGNGRFDDRKMKEAKALQFLKENIHYHQVLLRETRSFCRLYSLPLLAQSLGAGILIGTVILQIFSISERMTTLLIEHIMFTVTLLWNLFHLCSFATELNTKSRMAANALYGTPWYEMDVKNRRVVQFAIKKMMEGPKLKGGNMVVVNRVTYLKFLRISYNLIAVLRHMY